MYKAHVAEVCMERPIIICQLTDSNGMGWKHSRTICHGLIQTALEQGEALEHLQYIDDIIVWGNTAEEVFEKGNKIIEILLKAGFAMKQSSHFAMEAEEMMECFQEFPEHYKVILDRLNKQREQDQFTDITLIVDGHHFKAHKAVLAACSQFFYKFFQDFTQEPLVEIEDLLKGLCVQESGIDPKFL
ncbi:hypothetical protein llap_18053 [Limosa lapponica baueri]|uniref:BTB domain-containing protein n=1 Tax=Limosa lapponica baueri TaxID=1758121 RepID=A0A2I0TCW5_LIMLA|nr:hypothetical protein llap_18053 [Limosa lapponica baueri]